VWWALGAAGLHAVMYVFVLSSSINGLCHHVGYKNFPNTATNIRSLALVTGGEYRCIEEATLCEPGTGSCMVDCQGIARDVESATDGIVDSGTVEELCGRGTRAWGDLAVQALAGAWPITADTLDFSGSALITGQVDDEVCHKGSVPGTCAGMLGAGQWTGDLFFQLLQRQPGTWEAWRPE